jgi:precorrin-8X/cobalt-precorrin-8 methylmutase
MRITIMDMIMITGTIITTTNAAREMGQERAAAAVYDRSFAIIRAEVDMARFPGAMEPVALRIIHACGMVEIAPDLVFSPGAAEAGCDALAKGAAIFVDSSMVAHGIVPAHLPADNKVICTLHDERTAKLAAKLGITRSAAAVDLWDERLSGAIAAIGNAPTALFRLLERIAQGAPKPALILGFAVGFVGAVESKQALIDSDLPHIALVGRRGGSGMAAAAVNALARLARGEEP